MTDLAGAIVSLPLSSVVRTATVTAVGPLKLDVGGGEVEDAGTLGSVKVGDTVACVRQGQTWLVLGVVRAASAADLQSFAGDVDIDGSVDIGGSITFSVVPSGSSNILKFNHGYGIFVDNAGAGGNGTRFWIDGPDGGECVIGPRTGASNFGSIRLRTSDTTASAANAYLDAGMTLYKSTSSAKYKTNVRDLELDAEQVFRLRPVRFHDKKQHAKLGDDAPTHIGLIAEEVDAIGLGELVHYDAEGQPDGVQYERLSVALLGIVKDLAARVTALEEKVTW